jgi:DNA-binding protein HU-beta
LNRVELVRAAAKKAGITNRDTSKALEAAFEVIQDAVAGGDEVKIVNFGTFSSRERAARAGRNPQTGEEILIPAIRVPVFKFGKGFKEAVRGQ